MAATKISALTALTGANVVAADDVLAIVDTSVSTTKKITVDELGAVTQTLTNKTLTSPVINTAVTGTAIASQAQMEAAAAVDVVVTPGRMIYHPGIVKVAAQFGVTGNIRGTSYNVSSITDSGVGLALVNYSVTLSDSQHPAVVTAYTGNGQNFAAHVNATVGQTTTSTAVCCINSSAATQTDPSVGYNFHACGDI